MIKHSLKFDDLNSYVGACVCVSYNLCDDTEKVTRFWSSGSG